MDRLPSESIFNILEGLTSCKNIILTLNKRRLPEFSPKQWETLTNRIQSPEFDNLTAVPTITQDEGQYVLIPHYRDNLANKFYTKCVYVNLQQYDGAGMKQKWYHGVRANKEIRYFQYFTNVSVIGQRTFEWHSPKLTEVTIPDSVTSIERLAFHANELAQVKIPDSVTSIGDFAFSTNLLKEVNIPDGITKISSGAFKDNMLQQIKIPDSVTIIKSEAFRYNKLKKVNIPDGVTTIGEFAFADNNITEIDIPDSVIWIKEHAFTNNDISDITVPENTHVEDGAFWLHYGTVKIKRRKSVNTAVNKGVEESKSSKLKF